MASSEAWAMQRWLSRSALMWSSYSSRAASKKWLAMKLLRSATARGIPASTNNSCASPISAVSAETPLAKRPFQHA
jgi:hypothetical protein